MAARRRQKGEGTVIQLKSGKWKACLKKNGKAFEKTGATEKEVTKWLNDLKKKIAAGKRGIKKVSYESFLTDDFLKQWKSKSLKSQSYDRIESTVMCHIIKPLGFYDVENIDTQVIQDLIDEKVPLYAFSSVKKIYDAINESMKYAKSKGMIILNPVELVVLPPSTSAEYAKKKKKSENIVGVFKNEIDKDELEILSDEEIPRFIEAANAAHKNGAPVYKNSSMFILMLNTGLRLGEACGIKWSDYDAKHDTLRIRNSIIMAKDEDGTKRPREQNSLKTEDSERVLKLNSKAKSALPQRKTGRYIYCTKDGKPLRPRSVQNMLDSILKRAGIPHRSTHIFRHTFASRLFAKGIDVKVVSELLGHSSVKVTYNTYITLIKKQKAQAMDAIEDMY